MLFLVSAVDCNLFSSSYTRVILSSGMPSNLSASFPYASPTLDLQTYSNHAELTPRPKLQPIINSFSLGNFSKSLNLKEPTSLPSLSLCKILDISLPDDIPGCIRVLQQDTINL